ncbi:MAG TPA: type III restriction endonuclease subunit R, partial [Gammaproteobacteria bacterium]|nr:type III restriction endonuclease subunit R [Gammaproteobacteria bacterium]
MKIQFDPDLDHQTEAINSVVSIFEGQEICKTNFTVTPALQGDLFFANSMSVIGVANRLALLPDELEENVKAIQLGNGLKQSDNLGSKNFTVEMETGTGKTYVYLRSIFELNKKFGFSKFI